MLCLNCDKHEAITDTRLGILPCHSCQNKSTPKPQKQIELTSDDIKRQRKEFKDDLLQPWREGVLSKEYLRAHGTKGIKVDQNDIDNAQEVWTGEVGDYYNH